MTTTIRPHRVVLVGSSLFTARCLQQLTSMPALHVAGVVTNPQQFAISYAPQGVSNVRHADLLSLAKELDIPAYLMQTSMKEADLQAAVEAWQPDVILVAGWYHMVPKAIRDLAPCLGLHGSLLPKYSGNAPVVWALMEGAEETGVSLFMMESTVDSGPIVGQRATAITPQDTIKTLYERIETLGLDLIKDCLPPFLTGDLQPTEQDESQRTMYPQRSPSDGWLDVTTLDATTVFNTVRAQTHPYPGAFTRVGHQWLHLWAVTPCLNHDDATIASLAAGALITLPNDECWLGCETGAVRLDDVTWLEESPYPKPALIKVEALV